MKRAATVASGRNQGFETPPPLLFAASPGAASLRFCRSGKAPETARCQIVGQRRDDAFITLLAQAALAFQKYCFNNGLMLGTHWQPSIGMRIALVARAYRRRA
jgi:hypothetical protein